MATDNICMISQRLSWNKKMSVTDSKSWTILQMIDQLGAASRDLHLSLVPRRWSQLLKKTKMTLTFIVKSLTHILEIRLTTSFMHLQLEHSPPLLKRHCQSIICFIEQIDRHVHAYGFFLCKDLVASFHSPVILKYEMFVYRGCIIFAWLQHEYAVKEFIPHWLRLFLV